MPTLVYPPAEAAVDSSSIDFEWESVAGATHYRLEVNSDAGWGEESRHYYDTVYDTSQSVAGLPCDGATYYWRVWAAELACWSSASARVFSSALSDETKQRLMLDMVNAHRGPSPRELVLAIIRQESGEGAFHVNGWEYNWFYREQDAPWAQPTNDDGIMQVTEESGHHEMSGPYSHTRSGYDHAAEDGCTALSDLYTQYGSWVQATLHYNTGPFTLWLYMGDKDGDGVLEEHERMGDRRYLANVATQLATFVPSAYGLQNQAMVNQLNQGQTIVDDYLFRRGIASGRTRDYYSTYQTQLDSDLGSI